MPGLSLRTRPVGRLLRVALFTVALVGGVGCGSDERAVDVTDACNRLEDLSRAVLSVRSATSAQEVQTAVEGPLAAFTKAAELSGDAGLADLARTYHASFSTYLSAQGADAREAGNDANIALDRAGQRCSELGATNSFPRQS